MVSCNTKSQKEVEGPSLLGNTSQSRAREGGKKGASYYVSKGTDHTRILANIKRALPPFLAYRLQMTEMQWRAGVKQQFGFDRGTFLIYI